MASHDIVRDIQDDVASWFRDKRCQIIADDLWLLATGRAVFVGILKVLLRSSNNARLVISSRSQNIANPTNSESIVEFGLRRSDRDASKYVLCRNAGFELDRIQASDRATQNYFYKILERCNGLLRGLAMAGRSVRDIARSFEVDERLDAWKLYFEMAFAEAGNVTSFLYSGISGFVEYPG